ncbi:dihydrofolate reductase family protein [Salinibacterium sp. ZJ450]|uniref:dihydrofolate reductase family protein n=1 Tax=Salinibacterium sp. ZJ450 TaxID=2708338 RepID=UPI00141F4A13|nr:dihydrofolate reductase family protein [Salinibacterium sp. ZJ450]
MANLIYSSILSLDGYIADTAGRFDWGEPDDEVHRFVNDLQRPVGTYLYGRRLYEVMVAWESPQMVDGATSVIQDFASIWRAADKVVYSTTLDSVSSAKTRIERVFNVDEVWQLNSTANRDLTVGGPDLAAPAIRAGLVDEYHLFISPAVVGGGKRFLPDDVRLDLDLVDERRFGNGVVYLRYRTADRG